MKSAFGNINYTVIFRTIGILLLVEGFAMLTALPFTLYYESTRPQSILLPAFLTLISGFILSSAYKKNKLKIVGQREKFIIVSVSWIIISLYGCLPYLISGSINTFTDAFFESLSGFTTTGSTTLSDIESLPKDIIFWRSLTQWLGGLGTIVFTISILSFLGFEGLQLFATGKHGGNLDKMHPRTSHTVVSLSLVYLILTLIQVALLSFGEMNLFEALCNSLSTISSGGFATRDNSIASFSNYSQYIIMVFMLLSGTNFTLIYMVFKKKIGFLTHNEEFKIYLRLIIIVSVLIAAGLYFRHIYNVHDSIKNALFSVISILSTTGFTTVNYLTWPSISICMLLILSFIGGCAGSTAGGIKIIRHTLMFKNSYMEMRRALHNNAVIPARYNGKSVTESIIYKTTTFMLAYALVFLLGTIAIILTGCDFQTAVSISISNLSNIGVSFGEVGPGSNYSIFSEEIKWICCLLQFFGRLEIFSFFALFTKSFWRN